ncbi:MAG: hypothetical protein E7408_05150 [Ruminococcaceae bacterium]|nr:hypothetical protein [Oscillospiraceae bacterium]
MKKFTKVLALALVLVMAICSFTACGSDEDKVEKTVKDFLDAMIANDEDKALSYCDGRNVESQVEYALEEYGRQWRDVEYGDEVVVVIDEDGEAEVEIDCFHDEDQEKLTFILERIDGKWKIVDN